MLYRRRFLLAFLESLSGPINWTDFQKLLFLFCNYSGRHHYDFFPHKFGAYSLLASSDIRKLSEIGYLSYNPNISLRKTMQHTAQVASVDRMALDRFVRINDNIRSRNLIRKTYLEYPSFVIRSRIAKSILTPIEYAIVQKKLEVDNSSQIFTIGYEGVSIDRFVNSLIENNINALIDVRNNPVSMKPGFSKRSLAEYMKVVDIGYFHFPELGIPSRLRQDLKTRADYERLFLFYLSDIISYQRKSIADLMKILLEQRRVALTCYEADYSLCHRSKLAEEIAALSKPVLPVRHLRSENKPTGVSPSPRLDLFTT